MKNLIETAVENTKNTDGLADHYKSLLGERPFGSKWGRAFTEADFQLPWQDCTELVPSELRMDGCRYFKLDSETVASEFPASTLGAVPYRDLPAALLGAVRIEDGAHGPELRVTSDIDLDAVTEAWLIIGKNDGVDVVFTAHPGPLMDTLKDPSNKTIGDLMHVAVKIERG